MTRRHFLSGVAATSVLFSALSAIHFSSPSSLPATLARLRVYSAEIRIVIKGVVTDCAQRHFDVNGYTGRKARSRACSSGSANIPRLQRAPFAIDSRRIASRCDMHIHFRSARLVRQFAERLESAPELIDIRADLASSTLKLSAGDHENAVRRLPASPYYQCRPWGCCQLRAGFTDCRAQRPCASAACRRSF